MYMGPDSISGADVDKNEWNHGTLELYFFETRCNE
jgi:hypothetical protein